jgi:hypothetical protein
MPTTRSEFASKSGKIKVSGKKAVLAKKPHAFEASYDSGSHRSLVHWIVCCPRCGVSIKPLSLLRQMDTNRNGTVSKREFLQFMSRKFNRLDTNRNGKLERSELGPLIRGR